LSFVNSLAVREIFSDTKQVREPFIQELSLSQYCARVVDLETMHELSIAQNVIDTVLSETKKNSATRVLVIEVSLGELMQLDKDAFVYSLSLLLSGPMLSAAKLEVKIDKASFSCRKCSR
jgi:hypothetical protein